VSLKCPNCSAVFHLVRDERETSGAPAPVLRSSPALPAVPEDRSTHAERLQERREVEKTYRAWLAAGPDAWRNKFTELVGFKLGDWHEKRRREGKRPAEDYEVAARKRVVEVEALEQLVDEGFLRAPRPRSNVQNLAIPVGDRDEDPSEEE
jgi:hypothetical protein